MRGPLSEEILKQIKVRGLRTASVVGYRNVIPQPLRKLKPANEDVVAALAPLQSFDVGSYEHSSFKTEVEAQSAAYLALVERDNVVPSDDDLFRVFVRASLDMEGPVREVSAVDVCSMMSLFQTSAASGPLSLRPNFGSPNGTKKDMHLSAVSIIIKELDECGPPALIPYSTSPKSEVVRVTKRKVRGIQLEGQVNHMILQHHMEPFYSVFKGTMPNCGIGLSSSKGGHKRWFMRLYIIARKRWGYTWRQFLDWIEREGVSESDKVGWETSTGELDLLGYLWKRLFKIRQSCPKSRRLFARSIADYICPAIQAEGSRVFFAPFRVGSGSSLTADGNTCRHDVMKNYVCDFVEEHGSWGKRGCSCKPCVAIALRYPERLGIGYCDVRLEMTRESDIMGDDFRGIVEHHDIFDLVVDTVFGTETASGIKECFSEVWLDKPLGVEFLRRHYRRDGDNIEVFRDPHRQAAKLYHSDKRHDPTSMLAATVSAMWECGANRAFFDVLSGVAQNLLLHIDHVTYRECAKRYVRKNPAMAGDEIVVIPTYETILASNATMLAPLEIVLARRLCNVGPIEYLA